MARDVSLIEMPNYGIACQLNLTRQPLYIVSRKLFKTGQFFSFVLCASFAHYFAKVLKHCK